jgi:hypothetical protein
LIRLDVEAFARDLGIAGVRYVVTGSVAAAAYQVPVEPRDFDIAPELGPENLARLAELLRRWRAKPVSDPGWPKSLSPEECERWAPEPSTVENLDHLFTTPSGLFDVVPSRSGAYQDLMARAMAMAFEEYTLWIAHPSDLISELRMDKVKHQTRLPHLREVRERVERGEPIVPRLGIG